jgi:hypothetical protein
VIPQILLDELRQDMSLTRLAKTGLFQRMDLDSSDDEARALKLHRAVLDRALIDSFSCVPKIREDVEKWLVRDDQDFIDCCERAGLDSDLVFKVFKLMKDILKGKKASFTPFGEKSS